MKKTIDNHEENRKTIKRDNTIGLDRDARVRQAERRRIYRRGVPVIFMFTITAGVYGYSLGRKNGFLDGVNAGYVKGGQELIASWKEHSEQMRLSRGLDF